MANSIGERPFDNYRIAITDPAEFFGRQTWLKTVQRTPLRVRILLGGRRFGKTSALRAVEWRLLDNDFAHTERPFPVFVSLEVEQPKDLSNLRFILIDRLRRAINRWRQTPWAGLRETYYRFLRQVAEAEATFSFLKLKISNPARERSLESDDFREALLATIKELRDEDFSGVCFLLDEAEFIVRHDWANDACSYFRGLKDTDTALKSYFGLILSGYNGVRDYQQKVGSALYNIADIDWLPPLSELETKGLNIHRGTAEKLHLRESEIALVLDWSGGHPFLAQQMLNTMLDHRKMGNPVSEEKLMWSVIQKRNSDFSTWWNADQKSDGFGETERKVYIALRQKRQDSSRNLARTLNLKELQTMNALELLAGTGVIQKIEENYKIGSRLFEEWVAAS
jgi:hypothetical protein